MVNNSKISRICTVPSLVGDCGEIQELALVSGAANLEVQQAYESHDTATSLSLGLGSDCHEWLSVTVWVLIGDGVGTYQRQIRFLSVTVWE